MNKALFFNMYRNLLDKDRKLAQSEVAAIDFFLDKVIQNRCYFTKKQWAYVFATVFHETAFTFEPVVEANWLSEAWRKKNLRYWPYHGRGLVQITWDFNYDKFSKILGIDLVSKPDLALDPNVSFQILIYGMKNGTFTGRSLERYINDNATNYELARYVINGKDKRELIANYARTFELILSKSNL